MIRNVRFFAVLVVAVLSGWMAYGINESITGIQSITGLGRTVEVSTGTSASPHILTSVESGKILLNTDVTELNYISSQRSIDILNSRDIRNDPSIPRIPSLPDCRQLRSHIF